MLKGKQELDMHIQCICTHSKDHDNVHYTDVTSALDYKWIGVMDMETVLFN